MYHKGISRVVTKAFKSFLEGDYEDALFQICPGIGATAKKEGYKGCDGKKYKDFLRANIGLITNIIFGVSLSGLDIQSNSRGKAESIEEIIYHVIRCSLAHEVTLPEGFSISENQIAHNVIPKTIIPALIMAVVLSPTNLAEKTEPTFHVWFNGEKKYYLNDLWGKRDDPCNPWNKEL